MERRTPARRRRHRAYLRELTPALLRLDTRITNHGFDGTHATSLQSVFQRGTAILVDAHGVPRVRGLSGNPLTAPDALRGRTETRRHTLARLPPRSPRSGPARHREDHELRARRRRHRKPFNRPAGTTGAGDTPHTEPVAAPQPAPDTSGPPTKGHTLLDDLDGTYKVHTLSWICSGIDYIKYGYQGTVTITHQGNSLTYGGSNGSTGTVNPDGSFSVRGGDDVRHGNFVNEVACSR